MEMKVTLEEGCDREIRGTSKKQAPGWEVFTSCLVVTQLAGNLHRNKTGSEIYQPGADLLEYPYR